MRRDFKAPVSDLWREYSFTGHEAPGSYGTSNPGTGPRKNLPTYTAFSTLTSPNQPSQQATDVVVTQEFKQAIVGAADAQRNLVVEYCLQMTNPLDALIVYLDWSTDGATWTEFGALTGWPFSEDYDIASVAYDLSGTPITFAVHAGWTRRTIGVPTEATRIRLRSVRSASTANHRHGAIDFCLFQIWMYRAALTMSFPYRSVVALSYLDANRPGVAKQWQGCRVVQEGDCDLSFRFRSPGQDGRAAVRETAARRARGGERPLPLHAVGMVSRDLAPVFSVETDTPWTLGAVELEFRYLNAWA